MLLPVLAGIMSRTENARAGVIAMSKGNYWLDLFTGVTWKEFLAAGGNVSGFRESRWHTVQKIKAGDYLLCYLTGVSRFIGVVEVTSAPYKDSSPIWKDEDFPCRMKVKPVVVHTPETAVPVFDLRDCLSMFRDMKSPIAWTGHFRGSPAKWKTADGEAVLEALLEARKNPVARPVDPARLARRPKPLKARIGSVTVPESEQAPGEKPEAPREPGDHQEIQWLLLKLGSDMGFDVWVARNDRGRQFKGQRFADLPRLKSELPLQFDEATNRTIELIDVLWLKGNAIVAAFEVESTAEPHCIGPGRRESLPFRVHRQPQGFQRLDSEDRLLDVTHQDRRWGLAPIDLKDGHVCPKPDAPAVSKTQAYRAPRSPNSHRPGQTRRDHREGCPRIHKHTNRARLLGPDAHVLVNVSHGAFLRGCQLRRPKRILARLKLLR
jgi:predicted RNA-binding protein